MPVGDRKDPYLSYNFLVEIDGITRAGFREASGLDSTQDPVEYREGTDAFTPRKLPGIVKYSNISLKWGITDDQELLKWRQASADGKVERRNGSIVLLNSEGQEKVRWNFRDAWPTKWSGPSFNATGNEVAIETLELAHEGLTLQS
jgi:phage tail-like protein